MAWNSLVGHSVLFGSRQVLQYYTAQSVQQLEVGPIELYNVYTE